MAIFRRQRTLFVLVLEDFKAEPVGQKLSYFQIAGIHGYPSIAWDCVDPPTAIRTAQDDDHDHFYCAHNSVMFPTWHRLLQGLK